MEHDFNISEYRYERKFFIENLTKYEVESLVKLHPAIFFEIFNRRFVNNIYFDSFNLRNYFENIEGATDRIKIRIRWYGDLFGDIDRPILEIKIKKGLLGKKLSIPIKPFLLVEESGISTILKSIKHLSEGLTVDFEALIPTLLNRYSRKYYQSSDKKYRITIDSQQSFYLINKEHNSFLNRHDEFASVILELKYDQGYEAESHYITSNFPFRMTKSSKYQNGIQKILQSAF